MSDENKRNYNLDDPEEFKIYLLDNMVNGVDIFGDTVYEFIKQDPKLVFFYLFHSNLFLYDILGQTNYYNEHPTIFYKDDVDAKQKYEEFTDILSNDAPHSVLFACITLRRFKKGEPAIRKDPKAKEQYDKLIDTLKKDKIVMAVDEVRKELEEYEP
ncbi:MAG: hypothetical protein GYA62_04230 [Bacteroidales bacterium]|nr:hypothetical protein [Bacteroidales bacterium]